MLTTVTAEPGEVQQVGVMAPVGFGAGAIDAQFRLMVHLLNCHSTVTIP